MVTTRHHRPKFATSLRQGVQKIIERGGYRSLWRGNMTSVLHRFPYSAINFFVYENTLDILSGTTPSMPTPPPETDETTAASAQVVPPSPRIREERVETQRQLVRRISKIAMQQAEGYDDDEDYFDDDDEEDDDMDDDHRRHHHRDNDLAERAAEISKRSKKRAHIKRIGAEDTPAHHKFIAGALAGTLACSACYPLDLVRTRLTTELEGQEHYRGIMDAFRKIARNEGLMGFYSGLMPTLLVAVPNFAISYTVYGTLKEYTLDDELFYNFRKIDADSGEPKLGVVLTIMCGAASGFLATCITFPMDTIRRRMQIQNLHIPPEERMSSLQQFTKLVRHEGLSSLYRGLTPEILKVIPMVGTMFVVYEWTKEMLNVRHDRKT